jgi:ribosomal protein S18 acetylase RimI-like enzyme
MASTQKQSLTEAFGAVTIRRAAKKDIPALVGLWSECFGPDYSSLQEIKREVRGWLDYSLKHPDEVALMVSSNDNRVTGNVIGTLEKSEESIGLPGNIYAMGVTEDFRGQGIGRKLLEGVSESLRDMGARRLVLEVYTDNDPAIHLYETAGFAQTGVIPDLYGHRAYKMMKRLRPKPAMKPLKIVRVPASKLDR